MPGRSSKAGGLTATTRWNIRALVIPFFVAPLILGGSFTLYKYAFVVEMLAVNASAVWLVARQVEESEGVLSQSLPDWPGTLALLRR